MTVLRSWLIDIVPSEAHGEGQVTVERTEDKIIVRWVCGTSRHFTPADLRRSLERFDLVTANNGTGDLWYGDLDSAGDAYAARLANGNFGADARAADDTYLVPWDEFRDALRKAIPKPRAKKK